jgi:C-terminal peptidase prc
MTAPHRQGRRSLLVSAFLAVLIVLLTGGMAVYVVADRGLRAAIDLAATVVKIRQAYPVQADGRRMIEAAREAMIERLDRYSAYLQPEQFSRIHEELSGAYSGIGVTVVRHHQGLLIISVRESGPAAARGLLSGDIIVSADSISLGGLNPEEAINLLRGPEGSSVRIGLFRQATLDTVTVDISRRKIDLLHIPYAGWTIDSVIYVRLLDFEAGAADALKAALDSLLAPDRPRPHGLILDLRGNPGGLLSEACRVADLFLEADRLIVGTEGRSRWQNEAFYSGGRDETGGLPLAVLIDRGSASAAEIVAGALRQLERAVLVGDTTFGKGLVQAFTRFTDGSALRLTVSRYYLPGGLYLNALDTVLHDEGDGLAPDHCVRFEERQEFPRFLENSLLLVQFAGRHQDEIISRSQGTDLSEAWVERFMDFAHEKGLLYRSTETAAAELLHDLAVLEGEDRRVLDATRALMLAAQSEDLSRPQQFGAYIKSRLKQIAIERRFGTYRAYSDVITRDRPDIRYAASLLAGRQP